MKNTFKVLGIIAMVAVVGFSITACGDDGGDGGGGSGGGNGTFAVTGIPSEYNGKYAIFMGGDEDAEFLMGFQSFNTSTERATLVQIANGSVTLPMWIANNNTGQIVRYSGNSTDIPGAIEIYALATYDFDGDEEPIDGRVFIVTFSNGSAATTWSRGVPFDDE